MAKKKKKLKFKIITYKAVLYSTLRHVELYHGSFDSVSFGDAYATLVPAYQLVEELEGFDDARLQPLIDELNAIPHNVFVDMES